MDDSLRDYHLRSSSRGRSQSRFNDYLDTSEYNNTRDIIAPSRSRASTPSAAVRRAMQVLDDTYRQQSYMKTNGWPRSADHGGTYSGTNRRRRSSSPLRSRTPSPIRRSPNIWQPSRLVEIERDNFHEALDDSESRREILLNKLADAQKTMEIQNERLRDGEMDVNECKATIRLLQQVQQELETKTQFLQKERENFLSKSKQDAEEKECQRRKIEEVNHEANRLRCQLDLMLADKQQHHVTLEHLHKSIKDLKDQIKNVSELQTSTSDELRTTKERLKVSRQRGDLLEKEKNHAFSELEKSQKSQQALINRNTDLSQRLSRCQEDLQELSQRLDKTNQEYGYHKEELAMCRDKIKKQNSDLIDLRRSHVEMQNDQGRTLKYNEELEKTLQSVKEINRELRQAKVSCEDDITQLHADLAKTRLDLARVSEENVSNKSQLTETRKSCKQLTKEIMQLRPEVDELERKVSELEGTHKMDVQKAALLEAQKSQLSCEKEDALTKLSSLQESFDNLEKHHDNEMKKLNREIKDLRHEKDKANSQSRDAQAQYSRIKEEIEANTKHTQAQLDHWRQACSKLTSLVEEKDEDLRLCATQRREAEESFALEEAQRRTLEMQLNEAQISEEELNHLRSEHKRLSQECAENQQMITVLEMQRDILAKSPSKMNQTENVSKAEIDKLQAELSLMKTKLRKSESERDNLARLRSKPAEEALVVESGMDISRLKGVNQMLAEQLAKVRQEAEALQNLLDEKSRIYERDLRELKREKQQLELRMASMVDELNALQSDQSRKANESHSELKSLKAELPWLQRELKEKSQQITMMKGEYAVLENGKKRAEDRITNLEASLEELRNQQRRANVSPVKDLDEKLYGDIRIKTAKLEAAEAENAVLKMQVGELDSLKTSQNTMIEGLKNQLEKNAAASSGDSDSSGSVSSTKTASKEIKSLKMDLQRAIEEIGTKEKQISELKKRFLESQRLEQRARQERDELQGKTIIMESLNDSSQDLLRELDEMREEKSNLEKQLNNFLTTKTSQTPPTSLSFAEDLDRELEKQYYTVCERNKWLETRIATLQREIELVRDQNSLLQEQRNDADREATKLREQLKELQMTSKGKRRQSEAEQIHLQHSNAEKMQKILELERELSEKKQLIRAMTKEIESLQKKSDKGKISSFMKKLRRSSDSGSPDRKYNLNISLDGDNTLSGRSGIGSPPSTLDPGYSTLSLSQEKPKRASSLSPKNRSASFGEFPKISRSSSKSSKANNVLLTPLSPTLTYVTAIDTPSTGNRSRQRSREGQLSPARVSFDENSDHESYIVTPSSKTKSKSRESSPKHDTEEDDGAFFAEDYLQEDQHSASVHSPSERASKAPSPESNEPHPEALGGLPSPTSSPSLPSPSTAGKKVLPIYVLGSSEDSEDTTSVYGSDDGQAEANQNSYPPPMKATLGEVPLSKHKLSGRSHDNSFPPRPRSQPTFKEMEFLPVSGSSKKKRSSLV